MGPRSVKTNVM